MNNNPKFICDHFDVHPEDESTDVINLKITNFDKHTAPHVTSGIITYLNNKGVATEAGMKIKLNMDAVEYMDEIGLCAIQMLNRLSKNNKYGAITATNCGYNTRKLLEVTHARDSMNIEYKRNTEN